MPYCVCGALCGARGMCGCVMVVFEVSCDGDVFVSRVFLRHTWCSDVPCVTRANFLCKLCKNELRMSSALLLRQPRLCFAVSADVGPHAREEVQASSSTIAEQSVQIIQRCSRGSSGLARITITLFFPCIGHTREEGVLAAK